VRRLPWGGGGEVRYKFGRRGRKTNCRKIYFGFLMWEERTVRGTKRRFTGSDFPDGSNSSRLFHLMGATPASKGRDECCLRTYKRNLGHAGKAKKQTERLKVQRESPSLP